MAAGVVALALSLVSLDATRAASGLAESEIAASGMPEVCGRDGEAARLAGFEDPYVLRLADGRAVRLADIGPGAPASRAPVATGAGGNELGADERGAAAVLDLRPGRALMLFPASKTPDRWGRMPAHVRLPPDGADGDHADVWLSGWMVARGQALVVPGEGAVGCIDALYALESSAREAGRGLWRHPENRVLSAGDPALAKAAGGWRIVAGRVVSVGETKSTHYLNFGRDWSTDFTVTVRASDVQRFAAAGRHPVGLKGHLVRVRGWLREWNGAAMDVRRPGEIEVVDGRE
ncbi:hypothetical protein [Breoghania sp. L-A4]|uniref:thermonuclease family protein n=1 Tax=Breoghania sp. L-A4 TaxID=2304600 RepID=UPI000E3604C7|nr:hypothetical protein [Breoghania sp. L-A4]AXS42131.1 hypothetical protein D1F64_21675 [Breoghania sp. L-A4]